MRVGLSGPAQLEALAPFLDGRPATSPAPRGLGGQPVTALAAGLLRRGVEVLLVTLDPEVTDEVILDGPGLRVRVGPYRKRHRARDAFQVERRYISAALRRETVDLVHAHWTYEFALGALGSGLPTLTTIHDWAPAILRYHPHPYRLVRLGMQAATLRQGRYFTSVSPYIQKRVLRWTRRRSVVVPNALPDEAFHDDARFLTGDRLTLMAASNGFSGLKNTSALLRAFPAVRERFPQTTLTLYGAEHGPDEPAYRWACGRGLEAGVTFMGAVGSARLTAAMRSADLFVHPSFEESFGLVLLEAMATGLPVMGGHASGAVPWVLDGGAAGALADVASPQRLAGAIITLLHDPTEWSRLSKAGYRRAWDHFRLDVVLDRYQDLYAAVAKGNSWTSS